jgi:hypothetical protein
MTAAEKRHLDAVSRLPCVVCGAIPVEIHHVRRYGETRKHNQAAPLCPSCHRGPNGLHTIGKKRFEREFMSQGELLKRTEQLLEGTCHTAI